MKIEDPTVDFSLLTPSAEPDLEQQLAAAVRRRDFYALLGKMVPITGTLICAVMLVFYFFGSLNPTFLAVGVFYLAIALIYPLFNVSRLMNTEVEALGNQLALEATGVDEIEKRAEQLFKAHEIGLRRYYNQTLQHNRVIFLAGLASLVAGFAMIGATLHFVWTSEPGNFDEKLLGTILGSVAGVLANFIAAVYLKMFSATSNSLSGFHEKLVSTNHLHFANFLVAKVTDCKKRDDAYARIAELISRPPEE